MRESSILVMQHQTAHWPLYAKIIIMTRMKKYFRLATMYWKFFNQRPSRWQASDIWTNLDWASQSLNSDHQKWLYQSLRLKREYLRSKYIKPEFSIDWNSWADYYILIYATHLELMKSVGIMAAHHCYSWWRWWSDTLWATLIRLWVCSFSVPSICCRGDLFTISYIIHFQ
jgi:hypothetical protein